MRENETTETRSSPGSSGMTKWPKEWAAHDFENDARGVGKSMWQSFDFRPKGLIQAQKSVTLSFESNWADSVPALIQNLVAEVKTKRRQELQYAVIQLAVDGFEKRMQRLESLQTRIIPIDSFAPEPYVVLKPILATVNSVEDEFEAGWFDANIHSGGDNEAAAVRNLKEFILDTFDSLSGKPPEKLGPEPTRQLAVMKQYIERRP